MPAYFDQISQDTCEISSADNTQLYIIKQNNNYQIKAVSCGLDRLTKDPTTGVSQYWPITDIDAFIRTVNEKGLQETIFPNNQLTTDSLALSTLALLELHPEQEVAKPFSKQQIRAIVQESNQHMAQVWLQGQQANQSTDTQSEEQGNQTFVNIFLQLEPAQQRALIETIVQEQERSQLIRNMLYQSVSNQHRPMLESILRQAIHPQNNTQQALSSLLSNTQSNTYRNRQEELITTAINNPPRIQTSSYYPLSFFNSDSRERAQTESSNITNYLNYFG